MANHKRETPLTDDEKKERNRQYQHTRRHKTNNGYARAYRRTGERVIDWYKKTHRVTWNKWLEEELTKVETKAYRPGVNGKQGHPNASADCDHPTRVIIGFVTGCTVCGRLLGAAEVTEEDRLILNQQYEV
jgi:hypothetical protein